MNILQARVLYNIVWWSTEARYAPGGQLGLPPAVLERLPIGYEPCSPSGPAWTFPECDGTYRIIDRDHGSLWVVLANKRNQQVRCRAAVAAEAWTATAAMAERVE